MNDQLYRKERDQIQNFWRTLVYDFFYMTRKGTYPDAYISYRL